MRRERERERDARISSVSATMQLKHTAPIDHFNARWTLTLCEQAKVALEPEALHEQL
jgi:hypothetical protein